jgi:hypothetical protein
MSDFLTGLVKIRNGENQADSSIRGLEVVRQKRTVLDDAITSNKKTNLSRVSDKSFYKPSRISRISQAERPQKTQYIVLDSRAIDEIAEMGNAQRRKFLSRLSDGERRKVLRALKVRDDLEDGELERRDLNRELEPQDLYVINDLLTKYAYSRKDDELRMLESYKDILNDNDPQEAAVIDIINKVIDNTLDLAADEDELNILYDFLEDNEFETESLQTALSIGFGDTLPENEGIVGEETEEEPNLDLEGGDDLGGDDLGGEDLDLEDEEETEEEPDLDLNLGDSVKRNPQPIRRVSDNRKEIARPENRIERKRVEDTAKETFEDVEALIIDDTYDLAEDMLNGKVMNISDSMNDIVKRYTTRCGEQVRVKDCMDRAFAHSVTELSLDKAVQTQKVKDDIIDQIDERLGEESGEEGDTKTLLASLGSALEAFANGDTTELEALSELTVDDINPEEESIDQDFGEDDGLGGDDLSLEEGGDDLDLGGGTVDEPEMELNSDLDEEDEDKEDEDEDEEDEDDLKLGDSAHNAVLLAKLLVNKDKRANKVIDALKEDLPILKKYNFKISDSELVEEQLEPVDVVEPLFNREEFHSVYQTPAYIGEMAKESAPVECFPAVSVNYGDLSPVIQVECENGTVQNWIPIMGSSEKVAELLSAEGAEVEKIISDNCVPADDYYTAAAKTNNLGVIDSKFYKRKLSDEMWVCDEVPEFIKDDGIEAGATFAQEGLTTMPKAVPSGSVLIYGTKYNYYNKSKKQ